MRRSDFIDCTHMYKPTWSTLIVPVITSLWWRKVTEGTGREVLSDCVLNAIQTSCVGGRYTCPRPLQVDLWPLDPESGVPFTCDVGYLCANFSLMPLRSRLRYDVRDWQTSDRQRDARQHHRLMPPPIRCIITKHRGGFPGGQTPIVLDTLAMLNITSNIKKTVYNTLQEHVNEYTFMYQCHYFLRKIKSR